MCRGIKIDRAGDVSFRVFELDNPTNSGNSGLFHQNFTARSHNSGRRRIHIIYRNGAFVADHIFLGGIILARLECTKHRLMRAVAMFYLEEIRRAILLKVPGKYLAVECPGPRDIIGVDSEVHKRIRHKVPRYE